MLVQNDHKTPVHALAKRGGERGGDHTLHWLVVNLLGIGGERESVLCML